MTGSSVKFDRHQIRLILKSLPDGVNSRKRELLPKILKEWSGDDLKWVLYRVTPTVAKARAMRMKAIAKHAGELSRALDEFVVYAAGDKYFVYPDGLAFELAKRISPMGYQDEVVGQRQKLKDQREFLRELEAVASDLAGIFKRTIDQRRNTPAYRVVLDIAAIFEWLTNTKAVRRVERGPDTFGEFARSIWPVVFERGDDGLESALKNWAKHTKKYGDASLLIANIALRHPAWRVFES
jgi:hypothetical protein